MIYASHKDVVEGKDSSAEAKFWDLEITHHKNPTEGSSLWDLLGEYVLLTPHDT